MIVVLTRRDFAPGHQLFFDDGRRDDDNAEAVKCHLHHDLKRSTGPDGCTKRVARQKLLNAIWAKVWRAKVMIARGDPLFLSPRSPL
jgi:hypothetical protein